MNNQDFLNELSKSKEIKMENIELRQVGTQYAPVAEGTVKVNVPENLVAGILMEAQRQNEIFKRCRMVQTSQDTKINVGAYSSEMLKELDEFEKIVMEDFAVKNVVCEMARFATGTRVSRRLIASSNFDVVQHARLLFGDRLGLTGEKLAIRALQSDVNVLSVLDASPLRALVAALLKLKPADRANAVIVCSAKFFEQIIMEEDSNGRNKLSYELQQIRPTVMGVPVVVSDALEDGAYVGDFNRALLACVNVADVKAVDEPSVNAVDLFLNVYMGCVVQMSEAVVKIGVLPA